MSQNFSHPNGIFQPGVLAVTRKGRVLYRWRSLPNHRNVGGATSRVTAQHVWRNVQEALAQAPDTPDSLLDEDAELDSKGYPFLFFLLILFASGWFIKPNYFVMSSKNHSIKRIQNQLRVAKRRIPLFIIFWIMAIVLLPYWGTALIFMVWITIIAPQIYKLYRANQFNNEFGRAIDD